MALSLRNHGGLCCGMRHIFGFQGTPEYIKENLKTIMAAVPQGNKRKCRVIEVVLTQAQRRKYHDVLTEAGFKIVTRFNNANSRSTLNVYHYVKFPVADKAKVAEPPTVKV